MVKDEHVVKDDHGSLGIPENVSKFEYTLMEVSMACGFKEENLELSLKSSKMQ